MKGSGIFRGEGAKPVDMSYYSRRSFGTIVSTNGLRGNGAGFRKVLEVHLRCFGLHRRLEGVAETHLDSRPCKDHFLLGTHFCCDLCFRN